MLLNEPNISNMRMDETESHTKKMYELLIVQLGIYLEDEMCT